MKTLISVLLCFALIGCGYSNINVKMFIESNGGNIENSVLYNVAERYGVDLEFTGQWIAYANVKAIEEGAYTKRQALNFIGDCKAIVSKMSTDGASLYSLLTLLIDKYQAENELSSADVFMLTASVNKIMGTFLNSDVLAEFPEILEPISAEDANLIMYHFDAQQIQFLNWVDDVIRSS
jgi:hypothetical protein